MTDSGLRTNQGQAIPLLGVHVLGEVVGGHMRVKVRQRYKNTESKPVEAVYTFPLPSDATVCGFAMVCEGRRLQGVVRDRDEAFKAYDQALTQGHGAALLEQERKNVFTANVGNLLPNEETVIEVEYVQRLTAEEGALRWMLPTLVAPRYMPGIVQGNRTSGGRESPTDQVPDADRISPQIGDVHYGLRLELTFNLGTELEIESPSHAIVVARSEGKTRVSFEQREVALNKDVVVIARGAKGTLAGVAAHREGDQPGFFALTVVPDLFDSAQRPPSHDVVFVIDTSGSMGGTSMPQAQAALKLCLRHLREGDRFGIIAFSNSQQSFATSLSPFTQTSLTQADRWVDRLVPDGGTVLLPPLLEAVGLAPDGLVVLLTDGQVGNEAAILSEVLRARRSTRIATFGIGTNVSDQLLRDLARQTGGAVDFIHPGERIDEKVTAQFAKALAPRITDVTVQLRGLEVAELAPSVLPALVDGEPWVLFGRYAGGAKGQAEIRGMRDGQPFSLDVPVQLPAQISEPSLRSFWASERIADLEAAVLHGRRADAMKERVTKLAIEFGVSSSFTSFVVVEEWQGQRLANAIPETRFVPVAPPEGWAMAAPVAAAAAPGAVIISRPLYPDKRSLSAMAPAASAGFSNRTLGGAAAPPPPSASAEVVYSAEVEPSFEEEEVSPDEPLQLFSRQLASGLWDPGRGKTGSHLLFRETLRVLRVLEGQGITSAHAVYGAQVKKAIEAVLAALPEVAKRDRDLAMLALLAVSLLGTGGRSRAAISKAGAGLGMTLPDEAAVRQQVAAAKL